MRLAQEALNRARVQLRADSWDAVPHPPFVPRYQPAAVHAKPSMAVADAICPDATDAAGAGLGFAPLRLALRVVIAKMARRPRVTRGPRENVTVFLR